jgi:hypothetical protein
MTRLLDVMHAWGLKGETSRSGRWVRFHSERGDAYVVEAAWGGYYSFCDEQAEKQPDLYRDPETALQASLQKIAWGSSAGGRS